MNVKTYHMRVTPLDEEYYEKMAVSHNNRSCINCGLSAHEIMLYHVSPYKGMMTTKHKGKTRGPTGNRRLYGAYCNTHAATGVRILALEWKQHYALRIIGHWVEDYS